MIGYRYRFNGDAILKGSDLEANYIGVSYSSTQHLPGQKYEKISENTSTSMQDNYQLTAREITYTAQELQLVALFHRIYFGIGVGDGEYSYLAQL